MQGQGRSTLDKERQLAAAMSMQRNILLKKPSIIGRHPYYHIDLNAGCGWNKDFQVFGSPLVFCQVMYNFHFRAWFIDRDPEATRELTERLRLYSGIEICTGDNRDVLKKIGSYLPTRAVGSILVDPNSWAYRNAKGEGVPVNELAEFCRQYRRMDLIMNLNVRAYSMMDGHNQNGSIKFDLIALDRFPSFFSRDYWLISRDHNGHTEFVRLTGRNMRTGDYAKWGWYHWDSAKGKQIREDIAVRKKDRNFGQTNFLDGLAEGAI